MLSAPTDGVFKTVYIAKNPHGNFFLWGLLMYVYRTYSITTQRFGSTPVEWVVMLSIS